MELVDKIQKGDKLYYPSVKGAALICEVLSKSEDDLLVDIGGKSYYLPKESVNSHAIMIDQNKAKSFVTQIIEDPDNKLVYLRYMWNDTWVDKAYNEYCRSLNRIEEPLVIEPSDEMVEPEFAVDSEY
jgi:hypothetical protein